MNARPITWPTVPKGKDRVRVCLHSGNTKEDVDKLVWGVVKWAEEVLAARAGENGRIGGKGEGRSGTRVLDVRHVQERSKL